MSVVFFLEGYFGDESILGKRQVFRLTGLDEKSKFYKKRFVDLDENDQRKIKTAVLRAVNIKQLSPTGSNTSIYHIFERLNTGGTALKPQEIRNCVFRGGFVKVLRDLNKDENWRAILGKKTFDKHQKDVELLLRVFALSGKQAAQYEKPMKEFLNIAMKQNKAGDADRVARFARSFPKATKKIVDELGEKPFHVRGPLNSSVLDSVLCTVLDNLKMVPDDLGRRFEKLKQRGDYLEATYYGTSDASVLKARFELAHKVLLG